MSESKVTLEILSLIHRKFNPVFFSDPVFQYNPK